MGRDADIVVIGAGITGVATARALAQAGRGVILVEQFELGSRARLESRGLADLPPLLPRPALRPARPGCAAELAGARGGVRRAADRADRRPRLRSRRGRERARARVVRRPPRAAHRRGGGRRAGRSPPSAAEQVLYQPDGGTTLADRAYEALLAAAVDAGAVVLDHRRVTGIEPGRGSVRISTDGDEITANACVVAAGRLGQRPARRSRDRASGRPHARDGRVLQPSRSPRPPAGHRRRRARRRGARPAPARPDQLRARGARASASRPGSTTPGRPRIPTSPATPDPAVVRWVSTWAARRYPELDPEPIAAETCLYTNTADESFVLERHGRIVVASACSGHGFKFAPAFGRTIAALARDAAALSRTGPGVRRPAARR